MDPAMSPGATAEAEQLRTLANDMLTTLSLRAPELIAATSHAAWSRARTHLTAGLGLLRYHQQSAQPLDRSARISRLSATRDALMAQNLLDIRGAEAQRGTTLVFAHNAHLQRNPSHWSSGTLDLNWSGSRRPHQPTAGRALHLHHAAAWAAARPSASTSPPRTPTRPPSSTTPPPGA